MQDLRQSKKELLEDLEQPNHKEKQFGRIYRRICAVICVHMDHQEMVSLLAENTERSNNAND